MGLYWYVLDISGFQIRGPYEGPMVLTFDRGSMYCRGLNISGHMIASWDDEVALSHSYCWEFTGMCLKSGFGTITICTVVTKSLVAHSFP